MHGLRTRLMPLLLPIGLLALALVYMMPFLRPPTGREALDGHDLINQQYPLLSLIFDSIRDGQGVPLWNPYQFAGQSIVGNPQAALLYPPAWLLAPLGVARGVGWLVLAHLWLGGWGMACFALTLGASRAGAFLGGAVYSFSALMGAHLGAGHLNYVLCAAWPPWVAAAYLWNVQQKARPLAALPGAAALGMCILAGYPPLLYFCALWLLALWWYAAAQGADGWRRSAWRALRPLLVIVVVGALLGAALLLPVGQLTLRSTRTQAASLAFSNSYALPGGQLLTFVFPNLFGHPRLPDHGYWGLPFYEEHTAYVGLLPLLALFLVRRRPASLLLGAFVVLGVVLSLGVEGGLFPILYWLLPGYSLFRVPPRALYFTVVGAAGLAALLLTDLQRTDQPRQRAVLRPALRRGLPLLFGFAVGASLLLSAYFAAHSAAADPPWRVLVSANVIGTAAVFIGVTWLVLRAWAGRPGFAARLALPLTLGLVIVDLWHVSAPMVTVSAVDVPPLWALMARVAPGAPDYRVMTVPDEITWQATSAYTRHLNAGGYDPLTGDAYQRLLETGGGDPFSPVARLLGVRYVISYRPYEWSGLSGVEQLSLLAVEGEWHVYEVQERRARAFVATAVRVISDGELARQVIVVGALAPGEVIADQDPGCVNGSPAPGAGNEVTITRYAPNVVELEAQTSGGLLVLSDSYDPDWQVTVNGAPAELLRVYTALRGVCLPPGEQHVVFSYRPASFFAGMLISGAAWLALGILGTIMLVQRKRNEGNHAR